MDMAADGMNLFALQVTRAERTSATNQRWEEWAQRGEKISVPAYETSQGRL